MSMFRNLMVQSGGEDAPLYKQILAKMAQEQPALKEALVCWYSPKLQGLANEELASHYPTFTDGLKDLSGNAHHMTLYGMDGTASGGCVDSEGNLCFDGVNDYGTSVINDDTKYTYTSLCKSTIHSGEGNFRVGYSNTQLDGERLNIYYIQTKGSTAGHPYSYFNISDKENIDYTPDEPFIDVCTRATAFKLLNIARAYNSYRYYAHRTVYSLILFSRTLTDTEINYVKTNLIEI